MHDSEREKVCARCARPFSWRRKWARDWESVRYCSDACRQARIRDVDLALEGAILLLLEQRQRGATICPSEAARTLGDDWRAHMTATRYAANRLASRGVIVVTQGGAVVDAPSAKGAIRLRKA